MNSLNDKIAELVTQIKNLENRLAALEDRTAVIEALCQKILSHYSADGEIGTADIDRYFEEQWQNKYAPNYAVEDVQAVHRFMPKLINVCSGYYFEENPDAMMNDSRWDD